MPEDGRRARSPGVLEELKQVLEWEVTDSGLSRHTLGWLEVLAPAPVRSWASSPRKSKRAARSRR